MYKEELQEQITRCREMQSKCRIDEIDKTEKQLVAPVQRRETLEVEMF